MNERIRHSIYGEGVIKSIRPGPQGLRLSIGFDSGFTRPFIFPHPTIELLGVVTTGNRSTTMRSTIRRERQTWVTTDPRDLRIDALKKDKKQERLEKYRQLTNGRLSISHCRRIINRLKCGSVPTDGITQLTFGRNKLLKDLGQSFENTENSKSSGFFIQGYYGEGKSHLLNYLDVVALHHDFAVGCVSTDGYACALNHPQRFYRYIIESLALPGEEHRGLHNIMRDWRDSDQEILLKRWAERSSSDLGKVIWNLLTYGRRDIHTWEKYMKVIRGHDIYNKPSAKIKAIERLSSLGSLIRALGYSGIVLQFDEVESIHTLLPNIRSRNGAYEFLNMLLLENKVPSCLSVFAITPDFGEGIDIDLDHYNALALSTSAQRFLQGWENNEIPIHKLRPWRTSTAVKMAVKLREIHGIGREWDSARYVLEDKLQSLCEHHLSIEYSERSLVKTVVSYLDCLEQKHNRH